jgi:hypothetical protein
MRSVAIRAAARSVIDGVALGVAAHGCARREREPRAGGIRRDGVSFGKTEIGAKLEIAASILRPRQ